MLKFQGDFFRHFMNFRGSVRGTYFDCGCRFHDVSLKTLQNVLDKTKQEKYILSFLLKVLCFYFFSEWSHIRINFSMSNWHYPVIQKKVRYSELLKKIQSMIFQTKWIKSWRYKIIHKVSYILWLWIENLVTLVVLQGKSQKD